MSAQPSTEARLAGAEARIGGHAYEIRDMKEQIRDHETRLRALADIISRWRGSLGAYAAIFSLLGSLVGGALVSYIGARAAQPPAVHSSEVQR